MKRALVIACVVVAAACGSSGGGNPAGPSPSQTRVIFLEGDMNFGEVPIGNSVDRNLRIYNQGSAPLTITGMTGPGGFTASWTSGTIAPNNGFQEVRLRFTPTEGRSYNGTLTVNGDQTSGTNTKAITASGWRDIFTRSGVGNTFFDMPAGITRVHITGRYDGNCENFILRIGGRSVINEILGSCSIASGRTYAGDHIVSGTLVEITGSTGVSWSITELR